MKRQASPPRPDFAAHAAEIGFHFAGADGQVYWDESIRYAFSLAQIENDLESATAELGALCLDLVDRVVGDAAALARLNIPRHAQAAIAASWARRDPSLYGRFDFAYDGKGPPKLLEYNADTPTSLFESAVVQWYWLEQLIARGDLPAGADQFNSLHEKLIARWTAIGDGRFLHLACVLESIEDSSTTAYLEECARQAGLRTSVIAMADIGREMRGARDLGFRDRSGRQIELLFKLYPWEWMFGEPSGYSAALPALRVIEPAWKMILSNKGMLALLWEMAPGHPNLLPCFFEDSLEAETLGQSYARKPLFSREGANVTLVEGGRTVEATPGAYGAEGFVRQALRLLPDFDGHFPVCGCWLVGNEPAGLGIREDSSPVTSNASRFVPHVILG